MDLIASWGVSKIADAVWSKISGRGPSNALQAGLSIALQEFRGAHPKVHANLFEQDLFWDALQEEIILLLQPETQPDAKRLAQRMQPLVAWPIDRLERALDDLFRMIRQECRRQPDLITVEQFRIALGAQGRLDELWAWLGPEPDIDKIATKAWQAASSDLKSFGSFLGVSCPTPALSLSLLQESTGRRQPFGWDDLLATLRQASAVILEGEPGGGKTTVLLELGARLLDDGIVPILIPLPEHAASDLDFLKSVARRAAFNEQLSARHLQALARHGRLVLLMDGWNELSSAARSRARRILEEFRRSYPSVGFVLATRPGVPRPVLPRSFSLLLDRLTSAQRTAIIHQCLGEQADGICVRIAHSPSLDAITRIPLYLQALLCIHGDEDLPETREGVLRAFVKAHEARTEHNDRLQEELFGCHQSYLRQLAIVLIEDGSTALTETEARRAIAQVSDALRQDGQIATEPQPKTVLEVLAAHHLLLLQRGGEQPSCSFQHHQFQEWYASLEVEELVRQAALMNDARALKRLRAEVIDVPRWEQALLFAVERVSRVNEQGAEMVARMVEWCLSIDPLLAAEIIYRSGEKVWTHAAPKVLAFVECWHEPGQVDRGLAFMMASGRPEFADNVWPLIAHADRQVRLSATPCFTPFRISVLGPDLTTKLAAKAEEVRAGVLGEIASFGGPEGLELAVEVAAGDPSDTIRMKILDAARFSDSQSQVGRLLENAPSSFWAMFAPRAEAADLTDAGSRERVLEALHRMVAAEPRSIGRLRFLLQLHELGDETTFSRIFEEIERLDDDEDDDRWSLYHLLEQAAQLDPLQTSAALMRRLMTGHELRSGWDKFLLTPTPENTQRLAEALLEGSIPAGQQEAVARLLGRPEIVQLLWRLLSLSDQIEADPRPYPEELSETYYDLERILRTVALTPLVRAIVEMPHLNEARHAGMLARILAGHGGNEQKDQRLLLQDDLLGQLRKYIHAWIDIIRSSADGHRGQLADIAVILGRLGRRRDLPLLQELLEADLERRQRDREAWQVGGMRGPKPAELHMSYCIQYRRAFEAMPSTGVAEVVIPFLSHSDFAAEAAFILRRIWVREHGPPEGEERWSPWPDYSHVREQFAVRQASNERPSAHPLAAAILDRMQELLPESGNPRVCSTLFQLANAVADMDYGDRLPVILQVVEFEGANRSKRACLTKLVQKGETLKAELVRASCEAAVLAWQKEPWQARDDWWAVEEWLELLALSSAPEELFGILSNLPKNFIGPRRLERVLNGLKNSPAPGADEVLLQLAELVPGLDHNPAWLEAALAQSSEAMLEACAAILWDPARAAKVDLHHPAGKAFIAKLACVFSTDATARADMLAKLGTMLAAPVQRLLARVVLEMADDDELLLAYMSILTNEQRPAHYLNEVIEHRVTDKVPVDVTASSYEIVPWSSAALRRRLFEMMLYDRQRDRIARRLLVWIDDLRDRYGRPDDEPRHPWLASGRSWPLVEQPQEVRPS